MNVLVVSITNSNMRIQNGFYEIFSLAFFNSETLKMQAFLFFFYRVPVPIETSARRQFRNGSFPREKRRDESFQVRAKEPLGTDSHRTISKNSSGCRLLIGHKKCFVLLCPIGEQHLLSSFCEFVHDGY